MSSRSFYAGGGGAATPDADATTKGKVQLAGDLGGTAAAPTVPGLAGKAASSHTHAEADVTSLTTDLAAKLVKASNLSDLASASTARTNLGLGGAATLAVGTTAGTVAAGDDSRITGAAQKASNLSDLASASSARTNLGLGGAATASVASTVPVADAAAAVAGSVGTVSDSGHAHPRVQWTASDHGFKTWTMDIGVIGGNTTVASGTLNLARVHLPTAQSITNVLLYVFTNGTGLTANQCYAALYTSAGAKVDITADQSTPWASTGLKTMALAGGAYSAAAGDYYVAWWSNTGTTNPAFLRGGTAANVNAGLSAPNFRFATADTGLTTAGTIPLSLGTQTASNNGWWAGLS